MKVAITGSNGLVGSSCVKAFQSKGVETLSLTRNEFKLGHRLDPKYFNKVDTLIHAAYDFTARTRESNHKINVQGSIELFQSALDAGVKNILFVSSVSAFEGCRSHYGLGKLAVEEFVLKQQGIVVRPGLVFGDPKKGMFGTLSRITKLPILPVFDGGSQRMVVVHQDDLGSAVVRLAQNSSESAKNVFTIANPESLTFKKLLQLIAKKNHRRPFFVSIPSSLFLLFLRASEWIGIQLPFHSDNFLGLIHTNPNYDFSSLPKLENPYRTIEDF